MMMMKTIKTDDFGATRDDPSSFTKGQWVGYFGILTIFVFGAGTVRAYSFTSRVLTSANKIHDEMFTGVISSPTVFFESNPLGRVLNRFSNDIDRIVIQSSQNKASIA